MTERILTVRELADMMKLNQKKVYRLAAEARLSGFKVGGPWRLRAADIDECIADELNKSSPLSRSDDRNRR